MKSKAKEYTESIRPSHVPDLLQPGQVDSALEQSLNLVQPYSEPKTFDRLQMTELCFNAVTLNP